VNPKPTLMVIDGHSLAFRAFYALPVDSFQAPDGQHTNAIHGFISMFLGLVKKEEPTHVAVAFDVSRFSFRTRIYPEYKATRGETPSEFIGQVPLLQEALHAMGVPTLTKEDYEADDILATLATQGANAGMDVLVVSGDRDTFQLVNDRVTVLYPSARGVAELKRYTPAAVVERYGVEPHQYPEIAALVGETSDNLVGVDKVGEKTAVKWIQQYGSLDNLLSHVDEISGVVGQNLRDQTDRVLRNRQLNHLLTDIDVGVTLDALERKPIDVPAVREVFSRLAFKSLTERVVALAGGDQEAAVETSEPASIVALPEERLLVDEELAHWLSQHKDGPLGVSVRTQGTTITDIGLATEAEAIRVPVIEGGNDHLPLLAALGDSGFSFVAYGAKNVLKALNRRFSLLPRIAGDPALVRWISNPSRKSDSLENLVAETLGIEIPAPRADQLLPETDSVGAGVEAWLVLQAWAKASAELDASSAEVTAEIELPLVPILSMMELDGIAVDTGALSALESRLATTVAELETEAFGIIGHEVNLGSPKQLQTVLFEELGMPKTRATKTGFSTDASALQDLQESNPHPFLDALLAHRDATKLRQIIEGLRSAVAEDGRVHTTFDQTGTSTGRLSSLDPNVQNIPIRTEIGREIRACFISGPGSEGLFTADYSQIEMRIMAHLSGDEALIQAFHAGEDLHRFVGAKIFEVEPEAVTPLMRTKVKAMSYGLAYGLSAFGLAKQLRIPTSEAKDLMTEYFRRFGKVRDYLNSVVAEAKVKGYTETIFGRRRPFPDLASPNRIVREAAERAALNAPIQGTAADIIKRAMIAIARELEAKGMKSRMVLQVHDELVFELAPGERDALEALVIVEMGSAAELAVPLDVQVGFGANWDQAAH
jgi:DNA polymerase I